MTATRKDLDSVFKMDEDKEQNGVGINFGKLTVQIARAGGSNKAFAKIWEELTRPYKRMIENGVELPEDIAKELIHEGYAKGIVKDWNLCEDDGTAVPCTSENVAAEFKRSPEFFAFCYQESQKMANYRKLIRETEVKN